MVSGERIEALADVAEILTSSQPAQHRLSFLLKHARELLDLDELWLLARDRSSGGRLTRAARARRSNAVPRSDTDEAALAAPWLERWDRCEPEDPQPTPGTVLLPVRVHGVVQGVLVGHTAGAPLSGEDLATLRAYAALAAPLVVSLRGEEEAGRS